MALEPANNTVHVNEVKGPPLLFMDSHIHIQSSRTSTLMFLHDSVPFGLRRSNIESAGGKVGAVLPALAKATEVSGGTTFDVGMRFLGKAELQRLTFRTKEPYRESRELLMCCVIMTMDMEYAQLGGYFGLKIYNPIYENEDARRNGAKPLRYWYARKGTSGSWYTREGGSGTAGQVINPTAEAYPQDGETQAQFNARPIKTVMTPMSSNVTRKEIEIMGALYNETGQWNGSVPIKCLMEYAPDEEVDLYQNWKTQLAQTEMAVIASNLTLLSMYHYDPRRWQGQDNREAFNQVGPNGLSLGFKMYTAQGYRPWDPRIANLEGYYRRCQDEQIPILNHCTPAGANTFDMSSYIGFRHPTRDTEYDENQKRASMKPYEKAMSMGIPQEAMQKQLAADSYFTEYFISPRAWRIVLDKFPKLRLCLAHFGGATKEGKNWGDEIIRMIEEGDHPNYRYPNLYVDISSSFAYEDFRKHFKEKLLPNHPRILGRILFGTDWYMPMLADVDFRPYCRIAKEFLDGIDKNLWLKFTQANPYRFYRLGEQIGRISTNILKWKETEDNREASRSKSWKTEEERRDAEYAKQAMNSMKTNTDEITRRAGLIQKMSATLAH